MEGERKEHEVEGEREMKGHERWKERERKGHERWNNNNNNILTGSAISLRLLLRPPVSHTLAHTHNHIKSH